MNTKPVIDIEYFSDLLCVWAYIAQARIEELQANFGEQVQIHTRFCGVFGDTAFKVGTGWKKRGGYAGFARHVHEVGEQFGHVELHPDLWTRVRPASSAAAHLVVKAVQRLETDDAGPAAAEQLAWALRLAFFRDARDIARWSVLQDVLCEQHIPLALVINELASGHAHAALATDERDKAQFHVEGSPTFVLDNGRQKLYGNVGYRVLDANIRELIREPAMGEASWC